jgi:hypothetical protein
MALRPVVRFAGKVSKHGNDPSECEDSFCIGEGTFAVSDGASDGIYSDVWARILCDSYCRETRQHWSIDEFSEWVSCRRRTEWQEWHERVSVKDLPWFAREKLRNGSYATFAGLRFEADLSGDWEACSYGDACLFVVRHDALLHSLPLTSSEAFNNSPPLLATLGDVLLEHVQIVRHQAEPGDSFYLATDALAQWFLAAHARGDKPWIAFDFDTEGDLARFVTECRAENLLKNDDVTLVWIEMRVQE